MNRANSGQPLSDRAAGGARTTEPPDGTHERAPCDFCGATRLVWRKCKLICQQCGNINKSCADL